MQNSKSLENWSRIQAHTLICEFKKYPCLYSPLDINFLNKSVRREKMNLILNELKTIKPSVTIDEIKKKMKSLKAQLFKARQKVMNSKRSGSGAEQVYEPTLWCYDKLSFLVNVNDAEPSKSNIGLSEIVIEENSESCSGTIDEDTQPNLDSEIALQKKRKSKDHRLEASGIKAMEFTQNYLSNHPTKQPPQREEEFCRYLCRLLKKIKLELTFEKLELEIILLVNNKINEERKYLETNNFYPPNIRTICSSAPPSFMTSSSDSSNLPSPSTYQRFNYSQTIQQPSNFEPTSIPTHIKNKSRYTTSHPQNSFNTPSLPAYSVITHSPINFEEQFNFESKPSSPTPIKTRSPSPLTNNQFNSLQYNKLNPLIITSRLQNPNITYKNPINTPSPLANSLPKIANSPTYLDEHINLDTQLASSTSTSNQSKSSTCTSSPLTKNHPSSLKYIKCKPIGILTKIGTIKK